MPTQKKITEVEEIQGKLQKSQSVVFSNYRGLSVSELTELRSLLKKAGCELKVYKNRLVKIGAETSEMPGLDEFLTGPTAVTFSYEDPIVPAKILKNFSKDHKKLELKGGWMDNEVLTLDKVMTIADLPSKEELLARLLYLMNYPVSGLVNVLAGIERKLLYALNAIKEKKQEAN